EAALDGLGNRDRLSVGERAEVAAGTADDVGEQADVRRREAERLELGPQGEQLRLLYIRENQVLFVRDAKFTEAVDVRKVGDYVHLIRCRVARRHAGFLERERNDRVAGDLVRENIALDPIAEGAIVGDRGAES